MINQVSQKDKFELLGILGTFKMAEHSYPTSPQSKPFSLSLFKLPDPGANIYVQSLLKLPTWGVQWCSKSPPHPVVPPLGHNIDSCITHTLNFRGTADKQLLEDLLALIKDNTTLKDGKLLGDKSESLIFLYKWRSFLSQEVGHLGGGVGSPIYKGRRCSFKKKPLEFCGDGFEFLSPLRGKNSKTTH